ncbi:MAG: IS1634 family transposase [Candidatus Aureabacteria bacterium]|nr:IS1634 family transposase [Candidatus Auribacterota bacterium]
MFLKPNKRFKDGKDHVYYTLNESIRIGKRRVVQRTILHLGELTTSQCHRWRHTIDVINERSEARQMELLTEEEHQRRGYPEDPDVVAIRLSSLQVCNCREFGSCWIGVKLWQILELDRFWAERLGELRGEVPWEKVAELLSVNRLCDPGSELSVHEKWHPKTGMNLLLDCDDAVAEKDRLYRCLDRLLAHKGALEEHLRCKWGELFQADFEVLLYDLTSTYFEGLMEEVSKARRGYSRDKRPDCKQLVIALIVTAEGFPLAYEVFPGNTRDMQSLETMLNQVEAKYGKARRTWVFDRGVVSEDNLQKLRERHGTYVVGTPRSRLKEFEGGLQRQDWKHVRGQVEVVLRSGDDGDTYVIARSVKRRAKENAIRRRRMRKLYDSLKSLAISVEQGYVRHYDVLVNRLGRLEERYAQVFGFVEISRTRDNEDIKQFAFRLNRHALKKAYRQDGTYLLRTNLIENDPSRLWEQYIQLTEVESAFRALKSEIKLRPINHRIEPRVEAHVMVAFMGYAMWVCLKWKLKGMAGSLSPRRAIELFRSIKLVEVWFDTIDGRRICLPRITMPKPEHQIVLEQFKWNLPDQPPPRIYTRREGHVKNVLETRS